ncbi:MAG: Asp-tRNA(Asn)/Glu-tRNA(Gln) amidotransferase GatCAB subunit B, partial [Candidatus Aenigmarchaeota archaeon]|nr:Asp-tRNA(Asn)/Glu-tRNA(Gln) amidotransferase GatCAB subunit B [Candidatus Aenigmarchaeota archaeon]
MQQRDISLMIGLETHVQLNTKTKAFCGCKNPVNLPEEAEPNTLTCPVCIGLPGSKPSCNKRFVELASKVAIALGAKLAKNTFFSRKTYFYPDMSKNFQTTQYEVPLASGTALKIIPGCKKDIRLR